MILIIINIAITIDPLLLAAKTLPIRIFVMPISVFLIWPALHAMYGLKEHRSDRTSYRRKIVGRVLLFISAFLTGILLGFEHGFFIWLFALMAIAMTFIQLRVWQPKAVNLITVLCLTWATYKGIIYVF